MRVGAIPENLLERALNWAGLLPTPMIDTLQAIVVARVIMVATKLGIFEALADGPLSSGAVAARIGTDATATEKLLNGLIGAKYLRFRGEAYELAPVARKWLLKSNSISLRDNMIFRFLEWDAVEHFEEYVRTGRPLDVHDHLPQDKWGDYQRGMRSVAGLSADEVARRMPIPRSAAALLDIGGSHGYYSVAMCRRHPRLRATILDLPQAVEHASPILAAEQMGERVVHRAGNALTDDLGDAAWDLIFISQLVHHFDETTNRELMLRAARALRRGGVLAILEVFRPASPRHLSQTGSVLDLFFAATSLSGTWSQPQIAEWLRAAGLVPLAPVHLLTLPGAGLQVGRRPEH